MSIGSKLTVKSIEDRIKNMEISAALNELHVLAPEYGQKLDKLIGKYEKKQQAFERELSRYKLMCKYEDEAFKKGVWYIAGIDEAGRGPLAGPVVAAAVMLPKDEFIEKLNDSKKLSSRQRDELYDIIKAKAISIGVGIVDEKCIDEINILNATRKAMKTAFESLHIKPELVLVDAERLTDTNISQISIVKGDTLSVSIAAASIIAKVTRDRLIDDYDKVYPEYGFSKHKGYGTKEHIETIKKYGICPIHRISFTKNFIPSGS